MTADTATVIYECGCDALEVGQAFEHGLLVCPTHREPVAPFERPAQPARSRLVVTVDLETADDDAAGRFVDWLEVLLNHDRRVTAMTFVREVPA